MLQVVDLTFDYGKRHIFHQFNMEIQTGEMVALVGANGCGKSTLLQVMAGLKRPKEGWIAVDQKRVDTKYLLKQIGYVPQVPFLDDSLTVRDHLLLWYQDRKRLQEELEQGFLRQLGLQDMLSMKCKKLSGGMQKKVSIACALANDPQILLLDEPCAALDIVSKQQLRDYLQEFVGQGRIVITATHEEMDLEKCDQVIAMKNIEER